MRIPVGLNVWSRLVEATFPYFDEPLQRIIRQGAHLLTVNFADAPRPDGTLLFGAHVLPNL